MYSPGPTYAQIDGASFGPTFPPLFFMTYGDEVTAARTGSCEGLKRKGGPGKIQDEV